MSTLAQQLQHQDRERELQQAIGTWIFDQLNKPVPEYLNRRLTYPRCPHCKRRPELRPVSRNSFQIQVRAGSPETVAIPRFELLPCCSAQYSIRHEEPSRLERRRAHDRELKAKGK